MAAPRQWWKVVFKINFNGRGWSEVYYRNSEGAKPNLTPAIEALMRARIELLGGPATNDDGDVLVPAPRLVGWSVIQWETKRKAFSGATPANLINLNDKNPYAINPEFAVVYRLEDVDRLYHRLLFLRAAPSNWIPKEACGDRQGRLGSNAAWIKRLGTFMGLITNYDPDAGLNRDTGWAMRVVEKENPVRNPITAVRKGGTPLRWIVKMPTADFVEGQDIIIRGTRGKNIRRVAGKTTVIAVNNTDKEYTIAKFPCDNCVPEVKNFGTGEALLYNSPTIRFANFAGWAEKEVGGPFFATAGARRGACC